MSNAADARQVMVLAPMPLEMQAIVTAFGLAKAGEGKGAPWTGRVGNSEVTAVHIGMGPTLTREAITRVLDPKSSAHRRVDHLMVAGICGGLDPEVPVGTLINPELLVLHTTGATYRHRPPGDAPTAGKLITTEGVSLDPDLTGKFFADGFTAVDMESAAVAEVCEAYRCPWSVYRCISDRPFDGLLDDRLVAMTNPDGSGDRTQLARLLAEDPSLAGKLEQLTRDTTNGARLAAEAAVRGCLALDG